MSSTNTNSSSDSILKQGKEEKSQQHPHHLKKQITYSEGLQTTFFHNSDNTALITTASEIAHTKQYDPMENSKLMNRTNSFNINESKSHEGNESSDHLNTDDKVKLYSTRSVTEGNQKPSKKSHLAIDMNGNKLHRSKEIENLHDEQLEYSSNSNSNLKGNMNKFELEKKDLLNHTSHISRAVDLENLNEITDD